MEGIKRDLATATASSETAEILGQLLGLNHQSTTLRAATSTKSRTKSTKLTAIRSERVPGSRSAITPKHTVQKDENPVLSGPDRYALATETVNTCLKQLTDSLKLRQGEKRVSTANEGLLNKGHNARIKRPLQPRSGNTTPLPSPQKPSEASEKPRTKANGGLDDVSSAHIRALADCAHLSFKSLRSANTTTLKIRERPRFQLENGMLAFVSKLIGHQLYDLATRELVTVQASLEQSTEKDSHRKKDSEAEPGPSSFARLLKLKGTADTTLDDETIPVAINYYQQVLKLISVCARPDHWEGIYHAVSSNDPSCGYVSIVGRMAKISGDTAKAKKHLDALSSILLSPCPSLASSEDASAQCKDEFPPPEVVLKLQTLALRIRHRALEWTRETAEILQDTLRSVDKCMTAFVRRSRHGSKGQCDLLEECFEQVLALSTETNGNEFFEIHQLLATVNGNAKYVDRALHWATQMHHDCRGLGPQHARCVASILVQATQLVLLSNANAREHLLNASKRLAEPLSGSGGDYDILLTSLSGLMRVISQSAIVESGLLPLAAGFVQRYARTYPGKNTQRVKDVISGVMSGSNSNEDLICWLTIDAVWPFIHSGTLREVAEASRKVSLSVAWSTGTDSVRLGTISKTLILGAVRTSDIPKNVLLCDDDKIDALQRGVLLELQLRFMLDIASKPKYHPRLTLFLPDILQRLAKIYTSAEYPLRRARVACMVFAIRESRADLLPPHVFKEWQATDVTEASALGHDAGLEAFRCEIAARLSQSRLFSEGRPSAESLQPALVLWQRLLNGQVKPNTPQIAFDEPDMCTQQLRSIVTYFHMLGEDAAAIPVQAMVIQSLQIQQKDSRRIMEAFAILARMYLRLGHSAEAELCLMKAGGFLGTEEDPGIEYLEHRLVRAEFELATDKLEGAHATLERCSVLYEGIKARSLPQEDRMRLQCIRFQAWLLQSQHFLETGLPHDALTAAKNAVKGLNTFWQILEKDDVCPTKEVRARPSDAEDANVAELANGVSKLNLTPAYRDNEQPQSTKGAKFWLFMPVLCQALLQLSDLYAHHGRYSEARHLSDQAISIVDSVDSAIWLSRTRSHRCRLLILAGQLEEAELCLAHDEISADASPSVHLAERLLAKAALTAASGELEPAIEIYDESARMMNGLHSSTSIASVTMSLMSIEDDMNSDNAHAFAAISIASDLAVGTKSLTMMTKGKTAMLTSTKANGSRAAATNPRQVTRKVNSEPPNVPVLCAIVALDAAQAFSERMLLSQCLDHELTPVMQRFVDQLVPLGPLSPANLLRYSDILRKAMSRLEQDVTLNVLSESTVAAPAILGLSNKAEPKVAVSRGRTATKKGTLKALPKTAKVNGSSMGKTDEESLVTLFGAAHDSLATEQSSRIQLCSTSQTHNDYSKLSSVSALRYAMSAPAGLHATEAMYQASLMELPRVKALEYEEQAVFADRKDGKDVSIFAWPSQVQHESKETMTPERFQSDYVEIIPASWTAVSLCLSEDCKDLFIAQYRSGRQPLVLKQPFSRHKPDGIDDEAFDFARGRAELQEIIDLCNYTAHNHGDLKSKGGSTKWWNERKALDKRLHELLVNIESIWFGGFKSVFSQHVAQQDALFQFRQSFDSVLGKYLPSRTSAKGKSDGLQLDDKILELFIGLECDSQSQSLDDCLADLLYFVVDLLQFKGERNAYDEIDFDSMAIEVQDALQVYRHSTGVREEPQRHLVLVLDRRLQAFPWESMTCLQEASVSRVGSMLSLRQGILAMRKAKGRTANSHGSGLDHSYIMPRTSGTYILNPSSNLPATQTKLLPSLSTLSSAPGASWTSMVGEAPTEEAYSSALTKSSMFLYFGHGSGSQYIRPRIIKQLDRCSEVVWLMGCSSSKISEYGQLEASAVPLAYLLAGGRRSGSDEEEQQENTRCLAVVGCLWDVTDKDIDRFSLALGEEWGLWPAVEREKFPKVPPARRENMGAPLTPEQVPKTPKTPKVRKTLPEFQTPARRKIPTSSKTSKCSLVEAVSRSRDACYLRYLNGAAPVVYGIPVYLAD